MSQVGSGREQLLSRAFVGLADTLVDDYDIIDLLDRLVSYSVELLAADATGILLVDSQRHLQVVASSSEDADVMELLQVEAGYARNHNALLSEVARQVVETDLATDVLALAAQALHSPATEQR